MKSFHLEILTPERVFYKGECVSVSVPITDGVLGIMADRAPITASLTGGEAYFIKPDGERVVFSLSGGMVDAEFNQVKLLCDWALLPEEINVEEEEEKVRQARFALAQKRGKREYLLTELILSDAINNLKIKQKNSVNQ